MESNILTNFIWLFGSLAFIFEMLWFRSERKLEVERKLRYDECKPIRIPKHWKIRDKYVNNEKIHRD